ncbi:MAG: nucleotide exchange factor GrpE [Clostridiales bacterium]|nr:nucleotide exchange factor GrpE [Clostridiales bacterium]
MSKKDSRKKGVNEPEMEASAEEVVCDSCAAAEEPREEDSALTELTEKLAQAVKEAEEKQDLLLRTAAEYENFRKRSQREKEGAYADSKALTVGAILPVLDNLERALSVPDASAEDLRKGLEMTLKQFQDAFTKLGIEEIPCAAGEAFDPQKHNAVMHVDDESMEENVVAECFQKGYQIGDRVIRHSVVKVAN